MDELNIDLRTYAMLQFQLFDALSKFKVCNQDFDEHTKFRSLKQNQLTRHLNINV